MKNTALIDTIDKEFGEFAVEFFLLPPFFLFMPVFVLLAVWNLLNRRPLSVAERFITLASDNEKNLVLEFVCASQGKLTGYSIYLLRSKLKKDALIRSNMKSRFNIEKACKE